MTLSIRKFISLLSMVFFILMTSVVFCQGGPPVEDELGIFSGRLVKQDGTPFNGFIAFFSSEGVAPMDYGSTRRSPKMIAFTDKEGKFTTHLMPAGSYFVGAMERQGWRGGPPQRGEKRYSALAESGEYLTFTIIGGDTKDIGKILVQEPKSFPELKEFFTISGRLLDKKGKGIFDAVVVVKKDYNTPKAVFISDKSAIDGSYQIKLPPGKYFLLARETVAGSTRPKPGSIYGELGQNEPVGIGGKTAMLPTYIVGVLDQIYKDVDITMFKVPIPEIKRQETEAMVKSNKLSKESLPENLPLKKSKVSNAVQSSIKPETSLGKGKE